VPGTHVGGGGAAPGGEAKAEDGLDGPGEGHRAGKADGGGARAKPQKSMGLKYEPASEPHPLGHRTPNTKH